MEPKIPLSCISNLNDQNKKYIDLIKCPICGGVYFEPIYLKLDKFIACENCFFNTLHVGNHLFFPASCRSRPDQRKTGVRNGQGCR